MSVFLTDLPKDIVRKLAEMVDAYRVRQVCKLFEAHLKADAHLKSRYSVDAHKFLWSEVPDKGVALMRELDAHLQMYMVTDVFVRRVHSHACLEHLGGVLARRGVHLRTLDLDGTPIRWSFLQMLTALHSLTAINVSNNSSLGMFSEDMVNLELPPGLLELRMSNSGVRARALAGLRRASTGCPGLTALDVSFNDLRDANVAGLLAAFPALEAVAVANARLTTSKLARVVEDGLSSALRRLDISHNEVPDRSSEVSLEVYTDEQRFAQAEHMERAYTGLARCPRLTELRLAGLYVGEQADVLARALLSLPALVALDLADTGLGPWSAHVAQALPALPALVALNVSSCGLKTALAATRFGDGLAASTALRTLRAGDNDSDFYVPAIAALEARGVRVERRTYP